MSYRIATGHNVAFGSMTVLTTIIRNAPFTIGVQFPERIRALDGSNFTDGNPFSEWVFKAMLMTDFATFRTANGLSYTVLSAPVTIYTLKELTTYARYNATAEVALTGDGYTRVSDPRSLLDVTFRYTNLVAL